MEPTAAPTLRTLLERAELRLRLLSDPDALPADALERPVRWVHNSDLTDPTPFLAEDLVLLTTGTQLSDHDEDTAAYVARLAHRGVLALGFGSGVHRVGVPDQLVATCADAGIALFEVPYDVPFIAIARAHAEAIAAQAYARRTWALEAQRALAIAALRPRGLEATLTELSRRLGCWVGMYDSSGAIVHEHPVALAAGADAVAAEVAELLARGGAASRTIEDGDEVFTLFTFGRTGRLRGVIAIAAAALDPETRAVVTSVIAMAGLALEQNAQMSRARRRLHTQVLASLRADDPALARRVLGALPAAPIVVAVTEAPRAEAVIDWWERRRADAGTASFIAEGPEGLTMCVEAADESAFDELAARFELRIGVSGPWEYSGFSQAHAQALAALRRGATGAVRYAEAASGGVLDALTGDEARLIARTRLAPLRDHDAAGGELERTLVTWLEHDAHSEQTAAALGIHRHTLRSRIAQAASLLGLDLSSFPARAELWAALRAAGATR
ncbi:PucR family transcriptional regulator [Microbacterium sp. YJN-G]|uniref:PucR family transcriptional regulator n=1 Tax=Microbacterium sp. YJN-G TaxID=2763257 RepID=UPI0018783B25|nr:PucR family transcriptional regulator [Microbacterium sp. YJN-G]